MEKIQEILLSLFEQVKVFFPKLALALALLLGGWLTGLILAKILRRLLQTLGADRLSSKLQEIDVIERWGFKLELSLVLSKAVYYGVLLIFFLAAADVLGMSAISEQLSSLINWLPKLVTALMVLVAGLLFSNFLRNLISTTLRSLGLASGRILADVVFYFLLLTVSVTALEQAGLNTAFLTENIQILLAGIVIAFSLGFGLASQTVLRQLIAGNYNRRRFRLGDWIELGPWQGKITALDGTKISLELLDGTQVLLSQEEFLCQPVCLLSPERIADLREKNKG